MDRRRGFAARPVSSEELECWSQAAASLSTLTAQFSRSSTLETIERVNRLISAWPVDDTIPAEGFDGVKATYKKLAPALRDIQNTAEEEVKALDDAIERVGVLIALRKAPLDTTLQEKRLKRLRAPSPSVTPAPAASSTMTSRSSVSITLPARSSVGPSASGLSRDPKSRREALHKQLPLQEGRRVAFHPPPGKTANGTTDNDENTWILALVTRCINADKNRYEVQDAEPQEDGTGVLYNTTLRAIIPLPDPGASPGNPAHISSYQTFPAGATVLALYPDTSCFYRAEVIVAPKDIHPKAGVLLRHQLTKQMSDGCKKGNPPAKYMPVYKLKFEDDDNQEHTVAAQWVVEWPGTS
ncbi:SAGA-associated factor 29 [Termitomyces sp. J132]|nr:SAGA-associated factor 29 [Termitomyces sp. J132]